LGLTIKWVCLSLHVLSGQCGLSETKSTSRNRSLKDLLMWSICVSLCAEVDSPDETTGEGTHSSHGGAGAATSKGVHAVA
jgi:hypothetical protein